MTDERSETDERDIEERMLDDALINGALTKSVHDALRQHKRAGNSIDVWRDGRVVWVPPEEIVVPDDSE